MNTHEVAESVQNANRRIRLTWYEQQITQRSKSLAGIFIELKADRMEPWKCSHESFEKYCEEIWGMTPRRRQQLERGEALKALLIEDAPDMAETIKDMPEGQMRELGSVPEKQRADVLRAAQEEAKAKKKPMTSGTIKSVKGKVYDAATGKPEQQEFSFTFKTTPEHRENAEWFLSLTEAQRDEILSQARASQL